MSVEPLITSRLLSSVFDQCTEKCGWPAALIAALAYGTFGVPIKETRSIDVHPLVLQSYKTFTMFLFAWIIVLMGEDIRLTPWGILSGLLWVLGGTGGIFAIRSAGMAIAVGTWSSVMILVNFVVGIVCFREPVASFWSTCGEFLCLALGLVGMSIFSAPTPSAVSPTAEFDNSNTAFTLLNGEEGNGGEEDVNRDHDNQNRNHALEHEMPKVTSRGTLNRGKNSNEEMESLVAADVDPLSDPTEAIESQEANSNRRDSRLKREFRRGSWDNRFGLTKRQLGIVGAVINGAFTGCSLVPIHFAKKQGFGGATYMLSFASGALFANLLIWALWFVAKVIMAQQEITAIATASASETTTPTSNGSTTDFYQLVRQTYDSMPSFHFKQLYIPAFSAGALLSIAMFGSILSVTYLGQGVGNSIIQSKILIRYDFNECIDC